MSKYDYVRAQPQTRKHECHWLGCEKQVPPAMWGCRQHWYALPAALRARIWRTYQPGQEVMLTPSDEYLAAADAVQEWIASQTACHDKGCESAQTRQTPDGFQMEWYIDDSKCSCRLKWSREKPQTESNPASAGSSPS